MTHSTQVSGSSDFSPTRSTNRGPSCTKPMTDSTRPKFDRADLEKKLQAAYTLANTALADAEATFEQAHAHLAKADKYKAMVEMLLGLLGKPLPKASRARQGDANSIDPSIPLDDDVLIDQRCPRFPRDVYMRLARAGAFPNQKIGKRRVARYGDVKAAFAASEEGKKPPSGSPATPAAVAQEDDGLDELRQQVGFDTKGK